MTSSDRFYIMARYFIDGYNPKPNKFPVILDCILALPADLVPDSPSIRHFTHTFCRAATAVIENDLNPFEWMPDAPAVAGWLRTWKSLHG